MRLKASKFVLKRCSFMWILEGVWVIERVARLAMTSGAKCPLQPVSAGFQEDSRCFSISPTISSKVLWPNNSSRSLV
jgi:hypothetical protein